MNHNIYSLEKMATEINAQRARDAKSYRIWQKIRKEASKRTK
jgi:hypothetical protein